MCVNTTIGLLSKLLNCLFTHVYSLSFNILVYIQIRKEVIHVHVLQSYIYTCTCSMAYTCTCMLVNLMCMYCLLTSTFTSFNLSLAVTFRFKFLNSPTNISHSFFDCDSSSFKRLFSVTSYTQIHIINHNILHVHVLNYMYWVYYIVLLIYILSLTLCAICLESTL